MSRLAVLVALVVVICSTAVAAKGEIAFVRDGDVYVASPEGKVLRRLTTDGRNAFPMWSPDGKYVAFSKAKYLKTEPGQINGVALWIVTSNGKYSKAITPNQFAYYPAAWLPDSSGLVVSVWVLESEDEPVLDVVTLTGKPFAKLKRWARGMSGASVSRDRDWLIEGDAAAFSPGGSRLAFVKFTLFPEGSPEARESPYGYWADLCSIRTDGAGFRRMARLYEIWPHCLRWSPNGKWLLSAETRRAKNDELVDGIYLRDTNGRALRMLVGLDKLSCSGMDWSPDSRQMVYPRLDDCSERDGGGRFEHPDEFKQMSSHSSVWLVNADGSGRRKILDNACHPNWR